MTLTEHLIISLAVIFQTQCPSSNNSLETHCLLSSDLLQTMTTEKITWEVEQVRIPLQLLHRTKTLKWFDKDWSKIHVSLKNFWAWFNRMILPCTKQSYKTLWLFSNYYRVVLRVDNRVDLHQGVFKWHMKRCKRLKDYKHWDSRNNVRLRHI